MSLLPRSAGEFSSAEYWERFFSRRGDQAFEWYGGYTELCGVLHKYIKPQDEVLVVGCGNSELSEQLWDVGYKRLTNIDLSATAIANMQQRNRSRRPGLLFLRADATQTGMEAGRFRAALDKGTLDAMASEERGQDGEKPEDGKGGQAGRMLAEVGRVLCVGGRYVCVTLAQEHVLQLAVEHFAGEGWAVRVHCLGGQEAESDSSSFALPVFVLVCTKFRQPPPTPLLELCQGEDGPPCRLAAVAELLAAVRDCQAYALLRSRLRHNTDPTPCPALTLCHTPSGRARFTLNVVDCPPTVRPPRDHHFAIFIVPQGRESDWLYSSEEGRGQLALSAGFRRLVVVAMHRDQQYSDMQAVQSELSPMVMELAPPGMPTNQQVPFLSVGGGVGWRAVVHRGRSALSGELAVEDVRGEDGGLFRRLVFIDNEGVVQSESRLTEPGAPSLKKNKKKKPPAVPPKPGPAQVDRRFLCCAHHRVMVAGLALLCLGHAPLTDAPVSVLLVGLGGGGLPQFVRDWVPGARVEVVELDPVVLDVARDWFGLEPDERLSVMLGDGLEHINKLYSQGGHSYDVIMFDVDSKDPSLGMSCPPPAFVETPFLERVRDLLTPRGVFMLNLVCRDSVRREGVVARVRGLFPCVLSRDIEGEVNEVLLCLRGGDADTTPAPPSPPALRRAARTLQGVLGDKNQPSPPPSLDIAALLDNLHIA
ncbi:eEF1A lysine and N-terminal methyltransferase [Amia ocellicauda]|uniref:eEF1A lysine and N-terminal methyltransferase n=1 Tax=Amia ocellicauda TaxID=2972642 RepID=UPI0034645FDC